MPAEGMRGEIYRLLPTGTRIPIDISAGSERRLGEITLQDFPHDLWDEIFGSPYKIDADLPPALKQV